MKKQFKDDMTAGITPGRLLDAIGAASKYCSVSNQQMKVWLESDQPSKVIDEICDLVKASVDEKIWEKIEI
ncbi:hypothetical protein RZO31_13715 [Lactococcus lactis]|uniref:Uncharacterized protein n=1 Tax=Lactococcus lactis TaxID=1358 RepID=A0AAE4T091_9LACT|nr:hypothetical protein [Lactococcus lactis]MDV2633904.1 hypothetical protein [Lactococcus lactis]